MVLFIHHLDQLNRLAQLNCMNHFDSLERNVILLTDLKDKLKKWVILPLTGFVVFFVIIVINQSIQLTSWGFALHPVVGWLLVVLVVGLFAGLIIYPLISILRFKVIEDVPADIASPEYQVYVNTLHRMMQRNKLVVAAGLKLPGDDKEADLQRVFSLLDVKSDEMIKKEATQVFLTTAISQNGSLDGLFVLSTLVKMLWKIVHMYESRPSLRRIVSLYSNVAATVLIARSLEDMDLIEDQIEPLISSLIGGSVMTLVPGAVPITTMVVSSITEGSINSLLTLRCGCIAQRYMASLTKPDKKLLRRSASLEATAKLGEIMRENTIIILRSFAKATKSAAVNLTVNRFRRKTTSVPAQESELDQ